MLTILVQSLKKSILLPVNVAKKCWMSGKNYRPWSNGKDAAMILVCTLFTQACLSQYFGEIWYSSLTTPWRCWSDCFFLVCSVFLGISIWIVTQIGPVFANSVDPDQLASSEANWSASTLFVFKYVNFCL